MLVSRRRFVSLAASAAGLAGLSKTSRAARPRPKLVVLLVAEQFRSDYLDLFSNFLSPGGFRRLMEEGAYFPECQMAATTFTSGGLATVSTGAYPQMHGIVADSWYDRTARKPVSAAPEALQATTLAGQIASADTNNRIFAVALDSRDAALLAGPAQSDLFHRDATGHFMARGKAENADWLANFNQANSPEKLQNAAWFALGKKENTPPLRTLTYDQAHPDNFLALYWSSPYGQKAQMDLVQQVIFQQKLGQGPGVDFLAVALGSLALLGYEVGSDSPLMRELVLHLDSELQSLLAFLDKNLGAKNYSLAFTGAHGATRDPDGHRAALAIAGETVAHTINQALSARYDLRDRKSLYLERYLYPFVYLRLGDLEKNYVDPREARAVAGEAALRVPGVTGFYTADGDCSHSGDWLRRFRNSFHAVRSGDLMLAYGPEYVEDYGLGRGISYGSLYNYDTRVPLIFYGSPFETQEFETTVESIDLAPTLARAAGTAWPSSATGRVLGEALISAGEA
ncbi:MAG TPA: alkaline phosphatase family protein [Bryobacteraceae bacterium]|nr:alkaline phosphatase family protein [Bryobacteraceae bacterium]